MRRTGSREVTNRIWAQQTDCVVVPVCAAACSGAVKRTERPFGLLGDGSSPFLRWVHTQSARSDPLAVGFSFMVVLFVCFSTVKKKKSFCGGALFTSQTAHLSLYLCTVGQLSAHTAQFSVQFVCLPVDNCPSLWSPLHLYSYLPPCVQLSDYEQLSV